MILSYGWFEWWIWVRCFGKSVGDMWKKSEFEVEDDEISVWSLNLWKFQFGPRTLEKLHVGLWSIIRDSRENWGELWANF
jgi:hypothetical protein